MKALRILFSVVALLAFDAPAQTNNTNNTIVVDPLAAARAERARQLLRNATNNFRAAPASIPAPVVQSATTNEVVTVAPPPAFPVPVIEPLPTPGTNPAVNVAITNNTATIAPPGVAAQTAPAAQQPPIRFPTFPTIPAPGTTSAAGQPPVNPNPPAFGAVAGGGANGAGEVRDIGEGEIDLKGANIDQVFDLYQLYSGRTILRPYALPVQAITLHSASAMSKKEAIQALDSVLSLNGVVMIPLGDLFVKAVPAAQADKEGAEIDTTKASDLPNSEQFVTKIVTLKTAKPSEVLTALQPFGKSPTAITAIDSNNTIVLRDYASAVKRMMELIEKIDIIPEKDFTLEVIPIRYGKVGDIYATMSSLISGGGGGGAATGSGFRGQGVGGAGGVGNNTMNRNRGGSQYQNQNYNQGNRYGGSNPYGSGGYGGNVYPQQVAQPSVAANQNSFQSRLNNIISRASQPEQQQILENANIVPDERSNKLLIFANKRDMAMITNIVSKVDVLLAQVLIEAVILEVSLGDTLNYGVSAAQRAKQFTPNFAGAGAMKNTSPLFSALTNFPGAAPSGFSYFGSIGESFDVAISAIATDRKANVISRPRIQTSHAIPGNIFVGETRPYITGFSDYAFGSSVSTRSQVQEKVIGLTLDVTPYITPEGFVVMELNQQFDSFKGNLEVEGNPYPLVDSRSASSMLTVKNGDLIMMGGFITDSRSKTKTGVPFLKDIPGLGILFRSNNEESSRTELIILMKATVLESPEQAAFLAAQERATLPGVREAEMNQQKADEKRNRKINQKERKGF